MKNDYYRIKIICKKYFIIIIINKPWAEAVDVQLQNKIMSVVKLKEDD